MPNPNGVPENLKSWKPGVSGNPNGRPKLPEEIRIIRKLSLEQIKIVIEGLLLCNEQGLDDIIGDPESSSMMKWTAKLIRTGMRNNHETTYFALLDRLCAISGKLGDKGEDIPGDDSTAHEMIMRLMEKRKFENAKVVK